MAITAEINGKWIQISSKRLILDGDISLLVLFKDYSDVSNLHKSLIDSKHRTLLIAEASHELRTPLTQAITAIDMIKKFADREIEQYVDIADSSFQFLLNAVNDVLVMLILVIYHRILPKMGKVISVSNTNHLIPD